MRRTSRFALCIAALFLQGCANYMYSGGLLVGDSDGNEQEVVIYWPMTDPLIGRRKAGPVMVLTGCGIPIQFDQQEEGIVFRGNPQDHMYVDGETPQVSEFECGRFTDEDVLVELEEGPVAFEIRCAPVNEEFSAIRRTYIAARETPYVVHVSAILSRSFRGETLDSPPPPDCQR